MSPSDFFQAFPIFPSSPLLPPLVGRPWCRRFRNWQCSVDCSLACFSAAPCFVLFFVHVPPLGWLGAFIIVLFFVLRATPWLARGYDYCFVFCLRTAPWLVRGYYYRFHYRYGACAFFRLVWVCLMFYEVGFHSPTKLVSGDPLVYW